MNGIHDMGGMHGFGPVEREVHEPPFHARWEARVYGMNSATGHLDYWTIDDMRSSIEALPPARYLAASYYERWLYALENRLIERGLIGRDEIAAGRSLRPGKTPFKKLEPENVDAVLTRPVFERPAKAPARFHPGERVRARKLNPATHTRLPRYARGCSGVVEAVLGCHVFPDSVTAGKGEDPQWLYKIVFEGRELWGESADPSLKVAIAAFEPYLEAA
jgi:nitrile hydratase subunit beta